VGTWRAGRPERGRQRQPDVEDPLAEATNLGTAASSGDSVRLVSRRAADSSLGPYLGSSKVAANAEIEPPPPFAELYVGSDAKAGHSAGPSSRPDTDHVPPKLGSKTSITATFETEHDAWCCCETQVRRLRSGTTVLEHGRILGLDIPNYAAGLSSLTPITGTRRALRARLDRGHGTARRARTSLDDADRFAEDVGVPCGRVGHGA